MATAKLSLKISPRALTMSQRSRQQRGECRLALDGMNNPLLTAKQTARFHQLLTLNERSSQGSGDRLGDRQGSTGRWSIAPMQMTSLSKPISTVSISTLSGDLQERVLCSCALGHIASWNPTCSLHGQPFMAGCTDRSKGEPHDLKASRPDKAPAKHAGPPGKASKAPSRGAEQAPGTAQEPPKGPGEASRRKSEPSPASRSKGDAAGRKVRSRAAAISLLSSDSDGPQLPEVGSDSLAMLQHDLLDKCQGGSIGKASGHMMCWGLCLPACGIPAVAASCSNMLADTAGHWLSQAVRVWLSFYSLLSLFCNTADMAEKAPCPVLEPADVH